MRRILFLVLMLSSVGAWAEEFYWIVEGGPASGQHIQSPSEYCTVDYMEHFRNGVQRPISRAWLVSAGMQPWPNHNQPSMQCLFQTSPPWPSDLAGPTFLRRGSDCAEGTEYNPETGGCDQDCSATINQVKAVRGPDSPVTTEPDGRRIIFSSFDGGCYGSCAYERESSFSGVLGCYLVPDSTNTGFCNYAVFGTGDSCSTADGPPAGGGDPLNPPDPTEPPPDPDPDEPDPGCTPPFVWNGNFCQNVPGDGGGDGDGDGNGDGDGDNGGGGGPGGDGGNNGGGDGDGDGGDGDGSGDGGSGTNPGGGDGPGGDGDGDGSGGGGDGDGDGDGTCEGDDCGGGGDGGLSQPEQGSFDAAIEEYEEKIEAGKADLSEVLEKFGSKAREKININLGGGGTLPCWRANVLGGPVEICLANYSFDLSIIRNVILFIAAVLALLIIFGGSGRKD